jgi:peptidoglycan/LPS O-acetylase OafA/YrhL
VKPAETTTPSRPPIVRPRLVGLDVLRFLAASVVLCSHAHNFGQAGELFEKTPRIIGKILNSVQGMGWVAVDVFLF